MPGKRKFKIVIVEDSKFYNKILTAHTEDLCKNFPDFDFEIQSYLSGKECVEKLDNQTNLVIVDYFLDYYDVFPYNGFDVIRVVNQECSECKVVVISGQRDDEVREQLKQEGIYEYIDKEDNATGRLREVLVKLLNEEKEKPAPL